jgi:outer membrane lipoprotein SlyB
MDQGSNDVIERVRVREVAGVLRSREALEDTVEALLLAGFDRADVDVMAGADTVREKLGGTYVAVTELADLPQAPRRAFVAKHEMVGALAGAAALLTYIGATAAALAVVASGGAVALAAAAAAFGGAAAGGLGAFLVRTLGQKEAKELEFQLENGGIVLWVRVATPAREKQAEEILREHGAEAIRVHEIELDKRLEQLPLAKVRPDPWLGDEPLARA